jgi:hypothetical protein
MRTTDNEFQRRRVLMGAAKRRGLYVIFTGEDDYLVRHLKENGGTFIVSGSFARCIAAIDAVPGPARVGGLAAGSGSSGHFGAS